MICSRTFLIWYKFTISGLLVAIALWGCAIAAPGRASNCLDYLEQWQLKPGSLELLRCREGGQVDDERKLTAIYALPGAHGAAVEDLLHEEFGMERIHHICCSWHGPAGGDVDGGGQMFSISMYSDETLVVEREDWGEIVRFWVEVRPVDI